MTTMDTRVSKVDGSADARRQPDGGRAGGSDEGS